MTASPAPETWQIYRVPLDLSPKKKYWIYLYRTGALLHGFYINSEINPIEARRGNSPASHPLISERDYDFLVTPSHIGCTKVQPYSEKELEELIGVLNEADRKLLKQGAADAKTLPPAIKRIIASLK